MYNFFHSIAKKGYVIYILSGIILGVFSAYVPVGYWMAAVLLFLGIIIGKYIIDSNVKGEAANSLFKIFLFGLLLRVFLIAMFYLNFVLTNNEGVFGVDFWGYRFYGLKIAQLWHAGKFLDYISTSELIGLTRLISSYDYWNAFVYFFTDSNIIVILLINSLAASFVGLIVYFIAERIFGNRAAIISALVITFWPSFVLWSTQNGKDTLIAFFLCSLVLAFININKGLKISFIPLAFISAYLLIKLQFYVAIVFFCVALPGFLVALSIYKRYPRKKVVVLITLIVTLVALMVFYGKNPFDKAKKLLELTFARANTQSISRVLEYHHRVRTIDAKSAFLLNADYSSLYKILLSLPIGLLYVMFAPFPWQASSILWLLTMPEMLLWYILFPLTFRGMIISFKQKSSESILIILLVFSLWVLWALVEGNMGIMFRHRSISLPLYFIFTGAGIIGGNKNKNN